MWTEAALSASVRMEWESGPISRNLFISIVKSLKERKGLKMETSIVYDVCFTGKNRAHLHWKRSVGSEQIQPIPDYNACGWRDPRIRLKWISSSITDDFFNWFSIFLIIFPFSFLANFLCGQVSLAFFLGWCQKGIREADSRLGGFHTLAHCFYFL